MGMCQICKGARGRWLYGGIWNDYTYCFGGANGQSTGMCPNLKVPDIKERIITRIDMVWIMV